MRNRFKDTKKKDSKRQSLFGKNSRYKWTRHSKGVKYNGFDLDPDPVSLKKTARSGKSCYFYDLIWLKRVMEKTYTEEEFIEEVKKRVRSKSLTEKIIKEFLFCQRSSLNQWRLSE